MSASTGSTNSPSDCFTAQTIPQLFGNDALNSDVGGVAVAISNIVINIVLPILLRWAEDDVHTTVFMLLSQVYPIMIATALSINTDNLSLFDAHFAVAVTASPVSFYLAYSSIRDAVGRPNTLFQKLKFGKRLIRLLGLALPILWLGVNLVISFSPRAFRNSPEYCQKMTFLGWVEFQTVSNFVGVLDVMGRRDLWNDLQGRGGLGALSLAAMWIWAIYLVRHRHDIYDEMRFRRQVQQSGQQHRRLAIRILVAVYNVPASSWFVVTKSHPWMIFVIVICLHWSWVLGIAKGMTIQRYQFSYGQIMSLFSIIPPLLSVIKLLRSRIQDLLTFSRSLPASFVEGLTFLVTGSPNPWDIHEERHTPLMTTSVHALDQCWFVVYFVWVVVTVADFFWISAYVKAGSVPNPRTPVNDPHNAWKPFSVALYIYGYCVCCVNILVWTTYYGRGYRWTGKFGTFLSNWRECLSERQRATLRAVHFMLIPLAFIMCAGPLFSPFAALPLAQQWQWSHFCDSFAGEVILYGMTNPLQTPIASFYYPVTGSAAKRDFYFNYALITNATGPVSSQVLVYNGPPDLGLSPVRPSIVSISYNLADKTLSAYCQNTPALTGPCAMGNYSTTPYLSFLVRDAQTGAKTRLRAQDKEWQFSDDAPSFVLKVQNSDGGLGAIAIQSAVTQRNHCENLKICLSSGTPDFATLVPLGVILMAQDAYSEYCLRPRIYNI
ncbi:hypothetical protein BDZ97DRAFT_1916712 [Flammula alnicola]|nr:hypothetical protein BDZ97DRAFT_1916712 [Flammula alnicola]